MAPLILAFTLKLLLLGSALAVPLDAMEYRHCTVTATNSFDCDWPDDGCSFLQVQAQRREGFVRALRPPTDKVAKVQRIRELLQQKVVWIRSFPRSASSTLLSLLDQVDFPVFALFEPCSEKDELEPWLADTGCRGLLSQLSQCNFTGVNWLEGWFNPHSRLNGANTSSVLYSPESASRACKAADMVVLKTVSLNFGQNLTSEVIPFLDEHPQVKVIDIIRDPRSIYASFLSTWGFKDKPEMVDQKMMFELCDLMYDNLDKTHPRMMHVVYEDFVRSPRQAAEEIFDFLALPRETYTSQVSSFISTNFNGFNCDDADSFADCRSNSSEPLGRYAKLDSEIRNAFVNSMPCRTVALFYGFTPWNAFDWWR